MTRISSASRFTAAVLALFAMAVFTMTAFAHETRESGGLSFVVGFLNEPAFEGQQNAVSVRITAETDSNHSHGGSYAHGELITSGVIADDATYSFEFGHELEGLTIGYHVHPLELGGTVVVTEQAASTESAVMVHMRTTGFMPSPLEVRPGTTVIFHNMTGADLVLMNDEVGEGHGGPTPVTGLSGSLQVEVTHLATGESKVFDLNERWGDPGHYVAHLIPTAPGTYEFRFFGEVDGMAVDETFTGGPTTFSDVEEVSDLQFPVQLASATEVENAARGARQSADQALLDADSAGSTASTALVFGIIGMATGLGGTALGIVGFQATRKK